LRGEQNIGKKGLDGLKLFEWKKVKPRQKETGLVYRRAGSISKEPREALCGPQQFEESGGGLGGGEKTLGGSVKAKPKMQP